MSSVKKFLEFNGEDIYFSFIENEWWVALKPICNALGVDWRHQHKVIKDDKILGPASCVHTMQVGQDQGRKMFCLPEFFVYGWLFGVRSESPQLQEYQWECYRILYEHFKGTITRRQQVLSDKSLTRQQIENLEEKLSSSDDYLKLVELKKKERGITNSLKKLDEELLSNQFSLFD